MLSLAMAAPLLAQHPTDVIVDLEGARRTGKNTRFTPNTTQFVPDLGTGLGLGGGVDWFASDRVSFEAKVAALRDKVRIRTIGSDFIAVADLGYAQIYPITLIVKWHLNEHGEIRPYVGAGGAHVILHNIERRVSGGANGIRFSDPTGVVFAAGFEWRMLKKWSAVADVRYIPIETSSRARFTGTASAVELNVRPVILGTGIAYHF